MLKPPAPAQPAPAVVLPRDLQIFTEANQAMRAGDLPGAERLYRKALAINPRLPAAWANLGLLQANAQRYPDAARSFGRAHALEPNNPSYLMPLAQAQSQAGLLPGAEKTLLEARRVWPREESVLGLLATVQMSRERFSPAAETLKTLNRVRQGKDRQTLGLLVTALTAARKRTEARSFAKVMASRFPKDPLAHLLVGDLSAQLQDWTAAKAAYGRAFALNPKAGKAALAAGACAEKAGDLAGAEAIYKKLAQKRAGEPVARLAQGKILLLQKDYVQAQNQLEAAFISQKNAGSEPEFLVPLGEALLFQGRQNDARAREYLKAAVAIDPAHERARRSLAFLHLRAGRLADAVVQLRALLELSPDDDRTRHQIAELLGALGKTDAATLAWEELAQRRPSDPEPLRALAALHEKAGKVEDARRALRKALARAPEDTETLLTSAALEEKAGDTAAALRVLERAAQVAPESPAAQWALADLWLRRKQPLAAEKPLAVLEILGEAALNLARRRTTETDSPESWFVYGRLLKRAGRSEESQRAFDDAVKKGFSLPLPNKPL
jgi:tetratricopeptide (TPR) repeat protein